MRSRLSLSETGEIPFEARGSKWRRVNSTGRDYRFMLRVYEDNEHPFSANKVPSTFYLPHGMYTRRRKSETLLFLFIRHTTTTSATYREYIAAYT